MVQMVVKLPTYLQNREMAGTDFEWAYISTHKKLSLRKHLDKDPKTFCNFTFQFGIVSCSENTMPLLLFPSIK